MTILLNSGMETPSIFQPEKQLFIKLILLPGFTVNLAGI